MTSKAKAPEQDPGRDPIDYWFHGKNSPHDWMYRGKNVGYRCQTCGLRVTKKELGDATNA